MAFGILVVDRLLFFEHRVQGGEVFGRRYGGQRRISGLCDGGIGIPGRIENDAGLILRAAGGEYRDSADVSFLLNDLGRYRIDVPFIGE